MRTLSSRLSKKGVPFDLAGYSKGGGLAQEGGLVDPGGQVFVYNSAGIPDQSIGRTAGTSLQELSSRTSAFSSEGDFLTYLNQTTDPSQQIQNAEWLKDQLAKSPLPWNPIGLKYLNPLTKDTSDPAFAGMKSTYLDHVQSLIDSKKSDLATGKSFRLFPPVRASSMDTVPNTMSTPGSFFGGSSDSASFGKLYQHQLSIVEKGMEDTASEDRKAMQSFLQQCQ